MGIPESAILAKMATPLLRVGSLFAGRFEIEKAAGSGGMGTVYSARDQQSGEGVALKLLRSDTVRPDEAARFVREAQLLAELRHPGIVSYVAHGQTPEGQLFLAMEWLEGEDLGRRLLRGPLPLRDTLALFDQIADALGAAHARGVIHRDLKPANLFLTRGDGLRAKILDLGIARRMAGSQAMTSTGVVVGTPEYMAPEQARGARELTPAVDLFSLGCVLYECLTGQAPFVAEHVAAVLVRILFEDPPSLAELRPELPASLCNLVSRMLVKDPARRLCDAAALRKELAALGDLPEPALAATWIGQRTQGASFAEEEQNLCSVVLAAPPQEDESRSEGEALPGKERQDLIDALAPFGVAEFLASGALVVTVPPMGSASDEVTRAARAALLIKERWPQAAVSMATGRGAIRGRMAVGEVVELAARSLQRRTPPARKGVSSGVLADALSAKLLEGRFVLHAQPDGTIKLGEERGADAERPLLGKLIPCVGRESELAILDAQLTACIDESEARATVLSAAPGIGKSRLRHEFLRRVEQRSEPITCLVGRADMMNARAPYGILRDALHKLCGISGSEPLEIQQELLRTRVSQNVPAADRERVVLFLGELCDVPFPDEGRPMLQAARQDAKLMPNRLRRAFLDWLSAECSAAPVLLVLDDLHWGDGLTVSVLDEALGGGLGKPLYVLAFARPEIHEAFPKLWQGRSAQDLRLQGLGKKACARLIEQALGKSVAPELIARAVEQSAGNVLFLEELIRSIAEGNMPEQSETVLAMLQARIGRLSAGARRAIRAAAVFGQTFFQGGLAAILGLGASDPALKSCLTTLVSAELVQVNATSSLANDAEYRFRHALVRDAAYGLLTADDMKTGHRRAAEFLVGVGDRDAAVIADHFERSGDQPSAVTFYVKAAEDAYARGGFAGTLLHVENGVRCGASGQQLGVLRSIECRIDLFSNRYDKIEASAAVALAALPPGSFYWSRAMLSAFLGALRNQSSERTRELVTQLLGTEPEPAAYTPYCDTVAVVIMSLAMTRMPAAPLQRMVHRLAQCVSQAEAYKPTLRRSLCISRAAMMLYREPGPYTLVKESQQAITLSEQAGDVTIYEMVRCTSIEWGYLDLGDIEGAQKRLLPMEAAIARLPQFGLVSLWQHLLARALCHSRETSDWDKAEQLVTAQLEEKTGFFAQPGLARGILARVALLRGRAEEAAEQAEIGMRLFPVLPGWMSHIAPVQIHALLALKKPGEAAAVAEQVLSVLPMMGGFGVAEVELRLAASEAFHAAGDLERGRAELRETLRQIQIRAEDVTDPFWKSSYLTRNPYCARAQQLAREWGVGVLSVGD